MKQEFMSKKFLALIQSVMFVFGILAMSPFTGLANAQYGNCYVSISANSTVYDAGYYEWHSFPSGCPSGSVASSGTLTGDATRGRVFCSRGNISASYAAYTKTYSNGCICHQVSCAGGQSVSISGGGGSVHYSSSSQARSSSSVRSSSSARSSSSVRSSSSTKISDIIVKNGSDNNKVTSNKSSAKTGDVVTLTVSHEKGYLLYDLTIKDESDHEINPNGCLWYYSGNTCTFEMPSSKVTITPKFTSKLNADGGLFINMPKSGTLTVDVPDDVSSFNVYDDGGVNGDYSSYCAGYLKLKTNTDSDKFSLNGSVYTEKGYDYFYVYDGLSTDDKMLIEKMDGTNNPINAVTSSHNKMMLKFSSDGSVFKSGLALTATVIRNLNSENITVADIPARTYTGSAICPVPSVNYKGTELKAGTDYTVTCPYNVNPGTGSITITGKGDYAGSISKTFEILKAPLTVTAKNASIFYGDEPANDGVEYSGFVNGETENVLNGELSYSYDYAKFGNVGEYAITPSGLTAGNYDIEYVAGTLKVEPKIISIAWGEQTVFPYDGKEHVPTATADGLLNNDECELVVTGAAVNPGNYTATVTGLSNTNYKQPESGIEKEFKIVKPIAYIDEKGDEQTVTKYTVLTNDISVDELSGGWYVVEGKVKYTRTVKFNGDVSLILADGATLDVEASGVAIDATENLTIYGQSGQSGFLIVTAIGDYGCGIYSGGDITISGGKVTASNTSSIDAPICSKGDIKISGGTVTAYGNDYGIYGYNGITISGGTVTAYGNDYGIYVYNGITLGWTNSTDFIKANSYYSKNGSVSIAEGKYFKDEKGNVYSGPIDDVFSIAGKTLSPIAKPIVIVADADGKNHAYINGAYNGLEPANIENNTEVESVVYTRDFPIGKYSTTVLPFDVNTENVEGLDAVLRYNGIKTVNGVSSIRMKVVWATDKWVETNDIRDEKNNLVHYNHADLTANTPYLVQMNDATFRLKRVAFPLTLKETTPADVSIDGWTFRGTWEYKKWGPSCSTEKQNCDPETGYAYGFAASTSEANKISVGDFVKVGEGAWISPLRAYLVKQNLQKARANGAYVMRSSFAQEELPELMSIVIDNEDGNEEHTTVIGHFNTRTGEFKMNNAATKRTFDVKGRNVGGKANKARGAYYGKKVLKK